MKYWYSLPSHLFGECEEHPCLCEFWETANKYRLLKKRMGKALGTSLRVELEFPTVSHHTGCKKLVTKDYNPHLAVAQTCANQFHFKGRLNETKPKPKAEH